MKSGDRAYKAGRTRGSHPSLSVIGMVRKDVTDQTKTHKDKSGLKRSLARLSILITAKEEELDTLKEAWDHLTDLLGTPKYSENVPKPEGEGH